MSVTLYTNLIYALFSVLMSLFFLLHISVRHRSQSGINRFQVTAWVIREKNIIDILSFRDRQEDQDLDWGPWVATCPWIWAEQG